LHILTLASLFANCHLAPLSAHFGSEPIVQFLDILIKTNHYYWLGFLILSKKLTGASCLRPCYKAALSKICYRNLKHRPLLVCVIEIYRWQIAWRMGYVIV
jgi:hypothetical protein